MSPIMPRRCSKEGCPLENKSPDLTWHCFGCKNTIHLMCYGVVNKPEEIFVIDNVVMVCDECLSNPKESVSPKRKHANSAQSTVQKNKANMVQRTLDSNLLLSSPSSEPSSLIKSNSVNVKTHKLIESLSNEVKLQTATISALKSSVDSMAGNILKRNENDKQSNIDGITSIAKTLSEAQGLVESIKKPSFSSVVRRQFKPFAQSETPKSSRPVMSNERKQTPALTGTSTKLIGKPLSPNPAKQRQGLNIATKAIWVSKLHRDTTEDEILAYVRDEFGIEIDQLKARKLIKKDREVSSYTFISFKITCPANLFGGLMDVNKWPANVQIREFTMSPRPSIGVRLGEESPSKNLKQTPSVKPTQSQSMESNHSMNNPVLMDTSQVIFIKLYMFLPNVC